MVNSTLGKHLVQRCRQLRHTSFIRPGWRYASEEEDYFPFFEVTNKKGLKAKDGMKGVVFPYNVIAVTGPAGSGKTFSLVNFVANLLEDVGITGTTNTSVDVMNRAYRNVDLGKQLGTIFKLMQFKQPRTNYTAGVHSEPESFPEVQLQNLAQYWPTVAPILQDLDESRLDRHAHLIGGSEERAKLLKKLHPHCIPDLALLRYILIDECSQAPDYILDALAFIRSYMRFRLGLSTSDIPVFVLIGSPTQTQAFHADEFDKTIPCNSIIDSVFHCPAVRDTLDVISNSVRFLHIKRCSDKKFNECLYKLEHGISLWTDRFYFDQFVVEDENLITDPQKQFQPDVVRLFLQHAEVRAFIQKQADDSCDFLEEDIYCVVSVNDAKRFLVDQTAASTSSCIPAQNESQQKERHLYQKVQRFISSNNMGTHSQFPDILSYDNWVFVRQSKLFSDDGSEQQYDPPGAKRKNNFFDRELRYLKNAINSSSLLDDCQDGYDPECLEHGNAATETKEAVLFKNSIRIRKRSKVVICKRTVGVMVGFSGTFLKLLTVVHYTNELICSPCLFLTFLHRLVKEYRLHSEECIQCTCLPDLWEEICPFSDPFQSQTRLVEGFLLNKSAWIKSSLLKMAHTCSSLKNITISICVLDNIESKYYGYKLPKKILTEGSECQFLDFVTFEKQWLPSNRPFQNCENTFPEVCMKTALVKSADQHLIFILTPKPTFKHQEDNRKTVFDFSVLYDVPIQNLTSMTVAKSTGISLSGVCCVFPRKIKSDLMRAVYVMLSRVKNNPTIFLNYNIFKNPQVYLTFPSKAQLINQMQIRNDETLLF